MLLLTSLFPSGAALAVGPLRAYATEQAMAAASCVVDCNQIIAAGPELQACDGDSCRPLRNAIQSQKNALLPPDARLTLAHARLSSAKALLRVADAQSSEESAADADTALGATSSELKLLLDAMVDLFETDRDENFSSGSDERIGVYALLARNQELLQTAETGHRVRGTHTFISSQRRGYTLV